jgi:hypothetical protein
VARKTSPPVRRGLPHASEASRSKVDGSPGRRVPTLVLTRRQFWDEVGPASDGAVSRQTKERSATPTDQVAPSRRGRLPAPGPRPATAAPHRRPPARHTHAAPSPWWSRALGPSRPAAALATSRERPRSLLTSCRERTCKAPCTTASASVPPTAATVRTRTWAASGAVTALPKRSRHCTHTVLRRPAVSRTCQAPLSSVATAPASSPSSPTVQLAGCKAAMPHTNAHDERGTAAPHARAGTPARTGRDYHAEGAGRQGLALAISHGHRVRARTRPLVADRRHPVLLVAHRHHHCRWRCCGRCTLRHPLHRHAESRAALGARPPRCIQRRNRKRLDGACRDGRGQAGAFAPSRHRCLLNHARERPPSARMCS